MDSKNEEQETKQVEKRQWKGTFEEIQNILDGKEKQTQTGTI